MAGKTKTKRNVRKEVIRLFEKSLDLNKLNYKKRSQVLKPKSMLIGLGVAFALYGTAFTLAYWAMNNNILPLEGFAKLVWILMIPTTVLGLFAWQLAKNRMEYPIRQEILGHMGEVEKNGGFLWKFSPLMDIVGIEDTDTKKALAKSREGKVEELAVEDYTEAVFKLHQVLSNSDKRSFPTSTAESILENFGKFDPKSE